MSGHCIFLTGAPDASKLDWTEKLLLSPNDPLLDRDATQLNSSAPSIKWRSIDTDAPTRPLQTLPDSSLLPPGIGALIPDLRSEDFLEHSFAILQDPSAVATDMTDATFATTTSFSSTMPSPTILNPASFSADLPQNMVDITDLRSIPSAAKLLALHPQTPTVNLLCAVISLSAARTVRLRRHPDKEMEVLDLLLGDETRAGFSVSCWLQPADTQPKYSAGDAELRSSLTGLRAGDVVIVRNVALSVFRNCVYGQTLPRWRVGAQCTSVTRIIRHEALPPALARKAQKVREWAEAFVGRPSERESERVKRMELGGKLSRGAEELPPDTQD